MVPPVRKRYFTGSLAICRCSCESAIGAVRDSEELGDSQDGRLVALPGTETGLKNDADVISRPSALS